jgi:hypothetical protein
MSRQFLERPASAVSRAKTIEKKVFLFRQGIQEIARRAQKGNRRIDAPWSEKCLFRAEAG